MLLILLCLKLSFTTLSLLVILYEPALELFCTNVRITFTYIDLIKQSESCSSDSRICSVFHRSGSSRYCRRRKKNQRLAWRSWIYYRHAPAFFVLYTHMQVQQELGNHIMAATITFLVLGSMLSFSNLLWDFEWNFPCEYGQFPVSDLIVTQQKEGRQRGTWLNKKADGDFYKMIVSSHLIPWDIEPTQSFAMFHNSVSVQVDAYEAQKQELIAENTDLRNMLRSMQACILQNLSFPEIHQS